MQLDPWIMRGTWTIPQLWLACQTLDDFGKFEAAQMNKTKRKPRRSAQPDNVTYLNERQLLGRPDLMKG